MVIYIWHQLTNFFTLKPQGRSCLCGGISPVLLWKNFVWPRNNFSARAYDELRDHVESLFGSVPENLTLHRMKKYFFCFYHLVEKIRSFPTMYNTWGCLWGQIDETKHFLQKSGLKTPILAATVLDHPTSKRAETHNFWGIVNFHKCFEKSGT